MDRSQIRILVVDDVKTMQVQLKDLLKQAGFAGVQTAGGGEDAKKQLLAAEFHLVMADWHMIPTDGIALLEYMRSTPGIREIPFVMVTAEDTKENVVKAMVSGVDEYLLKPVTPVQISTKIEQILKKKGYL